MNSSNSVRLWQNARWLHVQGADALTFLQGYLTCATEHADAQHATPMAICNVKGRVVASGWVAPTEQGAALIVHASLAATLRNFLKPYVTFSKCELSPEDGHVELSEASTDTLRLLPGLSCILHNSHPSVWEDVSKEAAENLIAAEFAFIDQATSEKFLPQMLALHDRGAVDFNKGCYLGQEVVAHAQFRGAVKRHLVQFEFSGTAPAAGTSFDTPQGQHINTVVIAGRTLGLGIASA